MIRNMPPVHADPLVLHQPLPASRIRLMIDVEGFGSKITQPKSLLIDDSM